MHIIAILNQKGGVAKTTTAQAMAAGLSLSGYNVLAVDLDGQHSLTAAMGATPEHTIFEALTGAIKPDEAITHTAQGDIMAASADLGAADTIFTTTGREYRLREILSAISGYDYAVIDCPPSLGVLTVNALTAADECIIPAQADIFSLQALGQIAQTINTIKAYTNKRLTIGGVLITRYNGRATLSQAAAAEIEATAKQLGTILFPVKIRECIALKEAQAVCKSIFDYAPRSNGAADYGDLIQYYVNQKGGKHNGKERV